MKRFWILATLAALIAVTPADAHLRASGAFGGTSKTAVETLSETDAAGAASGLAVVGHNSIGGRGFNADVWVHDRYAYVGSWGFSDWASRQRFCPDDDVSGIAVIDARDATVPRFATLASPSGTSAEDVVVYTARGQPLAGHDIALVGIQVCGGPRTDASSSAGCRCSTSPIPCIRRSSRGSARAAARAGCTSSRSSTAPTSARRSSTPACRPASTGRGLAQRPPRPRRPR